MEKGIIHLSFIMTGAYLVRIGINIWIRGKIYTHIESISLCFIFVLLGFFMFFIGTSKYQIDHFKHFIPVSILGGLSAQFYVSTLEIQDIGGITPFVFHLGVYVVIYLSAPSVLKPICLLPLLLTPYLIQDTAFGGQGMRWGFFLLLSAVFWEKEKIRAFSYGLACSIKPFPCVLMPFFLIRIWKEASHFPLPSRVRKIGTFLLIAGVTFLICDLIFLVGSPKDLLDVVLDPINSLFVIVQHGVLFLWVQLKRFYTLASFIVFMILASIYFLNFDKVKHSLWIYPGIILWFAYQGEGNYFFYWVPMLIISLYSLYAEYAERKEGTS